MDQQRWRQYRKRHIEYLQENGIETALEYARRFSDEDLDRPEMAQTREALEEMTADGIEGLRGFSRIYPRNDQDVMIVNSNPKLNIGENLKEQDNYLLSITDEFKYREAISVAGGIGWLTDEEYFWPWVVHLDSLPGVSPPWSHLDSTEALKQWMRRDRFQNIYYTNWYKFASQDEGHYSGFYDEQLAREMLEAEIAAIEPDIILSFGGEAWTGMFQGEVSGPVLDEVHSVTGEESQLYKVHGVPFKLQNRRTTVLPLYHPSAWTRYAFNPVEQDAKAANQNRLETVKNNAKSSS